MINSNNNIQAFTFYRNYYEIIKYLPPKDKLQLYNAILEYMFENKEPELKGLLSGIWSNIKMPLDNNKKNIENGKKGGRPKETQQEPKENPKETQTITQQEPKPKANNISNLLFIISNFIFFNNRDILINKIKEWLEYKYQKKNKYTEIGFKKLLTQIEKAVDEYGEEAVINLIDECMASNYQGIIFDKLKNNNTTDKLTNSQKQNKILEGIYNGTIKIN